MMVCESAQGQPLQLEPDSIWFQVTLPEGQQHQDVRLRNTGVVTERFRLGLQSAFAILS